MSTDFGFDDLGDAEKVKFSETEVAATLAQLDDALARGYAGMRVAGSPASLQKENRGDFREFERELFPLCLEEGVGVIPYNPLAGGLLSGKYGRHKPPPEGTRPPRRVGSLSSRPG